MATMQVKDDDDVILVEFAPVAGVRTVSLSPADAAKKSEEAIDQAMKAMRTMAKKAVSAIREIPVMERPATIAVSFGLKLSAEGGAVVAKASVEAAINVTLTWTQATSAAAKAKIK